MVDSVNSTASTGTTAAGSDIAKLSQDYTTFLKLLTTQLQNQDPLSPMDSAQFTQQLVAFSSVEQQIAANDKLKELLNLQKTSGTGALLNYIGKEVEAEGDKVFLNEGKEATFTYTLKDRADNVALSIKDGAGNVVRTGTLSGTLGRHEITWDGKDNSGNALQSGVYTVVVTPTKTDGSSVASTLTTFGLANGVQSSEDGGLLTVGTLKLSVGQVLSVRTPPAPSAPTS